MTSARQEKPVQDLDDILAPLDRVGLDPHPWLLERHSQAPVTRLDLFGNPVWLVTGHAQVQAVLTDHRTYSNDFAHLAGAHDDPDLDLANPGGLGLVDPPDHTRLRRLLAPAFAPRRLAGLQPAIDRIVHRRLEALVEAGPGADLVAEFATPVPAMVIGELLGVPDAELEAFAKVATGRFDLLDSILAPLDSAAQSLDYLGDLVAAQRAHPQAGLIGDVIREFGDTVSDTELTGLVDGLLVGGHETTASMLALSTLLLTQNPHAAAVIGNPERAPAAVEELLRYLTVVQVAFPRFPRTDVRIAGQDIAAGDLVLCSLLAADRDQALVGDAAVLDLRRPPTRHLAFGHGIHHCLGAPLARMEMLTALPALLRRLPDLRLLHPDRLQFRSRSIVFGLHALPVIWTALPDAAERAH